MILKIEDNLKLSKEDKLLLLLARTNLTDEIKSEVLKLLKHDLDWEKILSRSNNHKLNPLLYWQLRSFTGYVPKKTMDYLKLFFVNNARENLFLTGELVKILEKLYSNNLCAVHYKGPSLALLAYNNLVLRDFIDLDIIVNRQDTKKVGNFLNSLGYELISYPEGMDEESYFKTQTEHKFINTNTETVVEIHNKLQGHFFHFPIKPSFLYDELKVIELNNYQLKTFTNENLLLLLSVHCSRHNWSRISWICDIFELVQNNEIEWSKVITNSQNLCVKRILLITLLLAENLFQLKLPNEILILIDKDKKVKKICNQIQNKIFIENNSFYNILERLSLDLRKRERFTISIIDVLNSLFKPTYEDYRELKLPYYLYSLYYLLRPILLLKRY